MKSILVVDDEPDIVALVSGNLCKLTARIPIIMLAAGTRRGTGYFAEYE